MINSKLIFISGVSSGFGQAIAKVALDCGHLVVGTVRRKEDQDAFTNHASGRAHAYLLDVTNTEDIADIVENVESTHGAIDVLINNAGYGHEGILEESSLEEMRRQFDVNVFGPVSLMKAVLPYMRTRRRGHIINITSMGGYITMPGIAYYCGSKFALEGISEVLAKEVASLGISVTAIAPGSFRTDWAGRSMVRSKRSIADYDDLFDPIRRAREEVNGKQLGDPDKAAQAVMTLIDSEVPPQHILLGSDAHRLVMTKLRDLRHEFQEWEDLTLSTDG